MEFARIAQSLQATPTPTQTAQQIIDYVCGQLDGDHAGISLIRRRGRLETVASGDPLVDRADALQYELGEGPCQDGPWRGESLTVNDLATDERWPRWAGEVAALGVCSILAAELTSVDGQRMGAISVYWSRTRRFAADDVAFVNIFARHAALALSRALNELELNVALDSRKLIGQAQGILMERYGLDEAKAFEVLRRYSQDQNLKLRRVAEHLVATRALPTYQ